MENKPKTFNKGEWSEAYTFVKLLGDGEVHSADEKLNKVDEFFLILKIFGNEGNQYKINHDESIVSIFNENLESLNEIECSKFKDEAKMALPLIINGKGSAFSVISFEKFLRYIGNVNFKGSSKNKADINLDLCDYNLKIAKNCNFSIKSYLGGSPSIINPSNQTLFTYNIDFENEKYFNEINEISKKTHPNSYRKSRLRRINQLIKEDKCHVSFEKIDSKQFNSNLLLIDSDLPLILSYMLFDYFSYPSKRGADTSSLKFLTKRVTKRNPLNIDENIKEYYYKNKVLRLLKAASFGMQPKLPYNPENDEVNAGFLIVRKDGEIVCLHICYDRDALNNYLFNNSYFDSPSSKSAKNYSSIETDENGKHFFKLNLQIRSNNMKKDEYTYS